MRFPNAGTARNLRSQRNFARVRNLTGFQTLAN
jgi:hypothetical protein